MAVLCRPGGAASADLRRFSSALARCLGATRGGGHLGFHPGDQVLEARRLVGEIEGALAFGAERLFGGVQRGLARLDQRREPLAFGPQLRHAT